MAQGPLKKTKPSTAKRYVIFQPPHNHKKSNSRLANYMIRPTALAPKRGPRQIAPKKATLIKQQKITKVRCWLLLRGDICWRGCLMLTVE
jgi:hypothetical protein